MHDQLKPITLHVVDITPQPTQRCRCRVKGTSTAFPLLGEAFRRRLGKEGGCVISLQITLKGAGSLWKTIRILRLKTGMCLQILIPCLLVLKPPPPTESRQRLELIQTVCAVAEITTKEDDETVLSGEPSWRPSNHTAWVAPCCITAQGWGCQESHT